MVLVRVLGPLVLQAADGAEVPVASTRQRRLLAALTLRAGIDTDTGELVELVWGVDPPDDPAGALQTLVARLRRLLPEPARIGTGRHSYRFAVPAGSVDAELFAAHLERARDATARDRLAGLDAALALWRGRPYAELDHPAVEPEVARLAGLHALAREQRAAALLELGRPGEAAAALQSVVLAEPLREGAAALLIRALAADGRVAEALAAYASLREALAEELGLDPSPVLRDLHAQVLRQELPAAQLAAPPAAPAAPDRGAPLTAPAAAVGSGALPPGLPVSSFIGRERELRAVVDLLPRRVVTLCGPGGVGKTRLARHVAASVAPGYADGVLGLNLGRGGSGDVVPALAAALRLAVPGSSGREDLTDKVVEVLAVRHQLLVLDNCEHVADAVADLVQRVGPGAPGVDVLLTSREPLRVDGEQVLALAPLPASAAQELLADRIGAADAAAAPGPQDRDLLAAIAHRLDGLPLALELAAVRAPAVGLPALLQALERPLDALQVRRRGVEVRHRSLRDVVQWSYQLLDPDEQALFVQMAVFAGPVEAGTVQAVCGGATVLPDLVDRSLVRRLPGEPASYDLLETLRAFGREQLATDPGTPQLRRRHAAWAVELAADVRAARTRPDETHAVRRFDLQLADLRRAHGWLCEHGPVDGLLTLALAFADLGFLRARADLVQLAGQGLAAAGHDPAVPDLDPARGHRHPLVPVVISTFAQSRWQSGDLEGARRLARRAIAVAERLGDPTLGADAYDVLANVTSFAGEEDQSLDLMRRGLALARAAGNRHAEALCITDLLVGAGYSRDQELALRVEQEAVELADELGSASVRAWVAYGRGEWRAELGVPGAADHLERAVQLAGEVDAAFIAGVARHTLLTTAARSAEADWPLAEFRPLIDTWHGMGTWTMLWLAIRALVDALSRRGRHREVALLLGALQASPRAPVLIGPDMERAERAERAARAALGERFEQLLAEGAALGDAGAVALAHELTA